MWLPWELWQGTHSRLSSPDIEIEAKVGVYDLFTYLLGTKACEGKGEEAIFAEKDELWPRPNVTLANWVGSSGVSMACRVSPVGPNWDFTRGLAHLQRGCPGTVAGQTLKELEVSADHMLCRKSRKGIWAVPLRTSHRPQTRGMKRTWESWEQLCRQC